MCWALLHPCTLACSVHQLLGTSCTARCIYYHPCAAGGGGTPASFGTRQHSVRVSLHFEL